MAKKKLTAQEIHTIKRNAVDAYMKKGLAERADRRKRQPAKKPAPISGWQRMLNTLSGMYTTKKK